DWPDLAEAELAVRESEGRLSDVHLARRCRLLQPCGDVDGVAHDAVLGRGANRSGDDHPAVDPDAQSELDPELRLHSRRMLGHQLLHADRAAERALRVVLVRDRRAEDYENRVSDELFDRAVVAEGLFREILEDPG